MATVKRAKKRGAHSALDDFYARLIEKPTHKRRASFTDAPNKPSTKKPASPPRKQPVKPTVRSELPHPDKKKPTRKELSRNWSKPKPEPQKKPKLPITELKKPPKLPEPLRKSHDLRRRKARPVEVQSVELAAEINHRNQIIVHMFEKIMQGPPRVFVGLHQILVERKIDLLDFCAGLVENTKVDVHKLVTAIAKEGHHIEQSDIDNLLDMFPAGISLEILAQLYLHFSYSNVGVKVAVEQVADLLEHLAMRFQLHRISKEDLGKTLFPGKTTLSREEVKTALMKNPCKVTQVDQADVLTAFLMNSKADSSAEAVTAMLKKNTVDWNIFNPDQEEEFDKQLYALISQYKVPLKQLCEECDVQGSGLITSDQFAQVLRELEVSFSPEVQTYLSLLFYSYSYDVQAVPYAYFFKAYSQPIEDYELEEEERASVVRQHLEVIAAALIEQGKSIRTGFVAKEGFISPDDFVKGLKALGVRDTSEETAVLLVEALQYEGDDDQVMISQDELEELFEYYGVTRDSSNDPQISSDTEPHQVASF